MNDTKAPGRLADGRAEAEAADGSTGSASVARRSDVAVPLGELRAKLGPALPPPWRWRCPCGCMSAVDPECARHRLRSRESARAAWAHLRDADLLDDQDWTVAVLARAVAA